MKNRKLKFWTGYHVGLLLFSIAAGMLMKYHQTGNALDPTVIVTISTIFLMSAGIGYAAIFMVNRAKQYNQARLNKMIIPGLLIFYVSSYIIAMLSVTLGVFAWFLHLGRDLSEFWPHLFRYELNFASSRLLMWLLFFTIAFFYVLWYKSSRKEQKLREENLKYRYRILKAQINPHFLFNSLNTLSELVYVDAKKSDKYIQKLSGIYRYVLENEDTDLISLDKELEFVREYFSLQQERDNGKIGLKINIQNPKDYQVIPVSIQSLVENALKHNAISMEKPLNITISLSESHIVVTNPVQRKSIIKDTTRAGLPNLKNRARLIMGSEPLISEKNNIFTVKLPVTRTT